MWIIAASTTDRAGGDLMEDKLYLFELMRQKTTEYVCYSVHNLTLIGFHINV